VATIAAKAQLVSASASASDSDPAAAVAADAAAPAGATPAAQSFSGVALAAHQYVWVLLLGVFINDITYT